MTSYSHNECYFNEIDALSCNNRPIAATLRSKSAYNAYECQTEDETACDLYSNQDYSEGSRCDSYKYDQRYLSTVSNAGNYTVPFCNNDCKQYRKNTISSDNLMYHRDACNGDSGDRYDIYPTLESANNSHSKGNHINFEATTVPYDNSSQYTPFEDSNIKILPQVPPVQHSHNTWDGMYDTGEYKQSNASLSSTLTFRYNCGSTDGGDMYFNTDWDGGIIANGVKVQLNGYQNYNHSGGAFCRRRPPERILPLPQSYRQPQMHMKKSLKQQFFKDNSDNMATTAPMSPYQNTITLDYKKALPISSSADQNLTSHSICYDNGSIEKQLSTREKDYKNSYCTYESAYTIQTHPNTAMQSTDEYNDLTNFTIVPIRTTTNANQQNLQDFRKCRYSIIMAMTTASVIASGETRIPQHLLKKTIKPLAGFAKDVSTASDISGAVTTADMTSFNPYSYDDSSSNVYIDSNNKNNINGSNNFMSCAYTNVTMSPSQSLLASVTLPAAASSSILLLSSASPIVASSVTGIESSNNTMAETAGVSNGIPEGLSLVKNITSKKLPKHHLGFTKQLPQSLQFPLTHQNVPLSNKTLPVISQKTDTLGNINKTSSISSTTSSSAPSTLSVLSYQESIPSVSNSLIATAKKMDVTAVATSLITIITTSTTLAASANELLPNNNNSNTCIKNYDNFNNYENNNYYIHNEGKYTTKSTKNETETRQDAEDIIHNLSTTPSIVNSQASINEEDSFISPPFKSGEVYDPLNSFSSIQTETTSEMVTTTKNVALRKTKITTTSPTNTFDSRSIFASDYKVNYDYDYFDYLKPYTMPTYSTNNSSGNITNLQYTLTNTSNISNSSSSSLPYPNLDSHADYLKFSNSITSDISRTAISSSAVPLTSESLLTPISNNTALSASTNLAINNSGFNNIITVFNLYDSNISRKNSISSPVSKVVSASDSVVPITSITCYENEAETKLIRATTNNILPSIVQTSITSSSSVTLATYVDHASNQRGQKHQSNDISGLDMNTDFEEYSTSSLHIREYDNYIKDYKLKFTSPLTTSTTLTATLTTTLNDSQPITTTTTSFSATTTKTTEILTTNATCFNTINNNEVSDITISPAAEIKVVSQKDLLTITVDTSKPASYGDYLKDYSSVLSMSSSADFLSETTKKSSQDLPPYIKDFLITSKSNAFSENSYLNLYKIQKEENTIIDAITPDTSFVNATNNNNVISNNTDFVSDIPATAIHDITDIYMTAMTTITTPTSEVTERDTALHDTKITTENQATANEALTMVDFDDSFYDSFSVNLNSLISQAVETGNSDITELKHDCVILPEVSENAEPSHTTSSISLFAASTASQALFSTSSLGASNSEANQGYFYTASSSSIGVTTSVITTSATESNEEPSPQTPKSLSIINQKQKVTENKVTSKLGGISHSIIGGLDDVLGGASNTTEQHQQQKRSFGFGLASKFVPNVGGLLGSATKSTFSSTTTTLKSPKVPATPITTNSYTQLVSNGSFNGVAAGNVTIANSTNKEIEYAALTHTTELYSNKANEVTGVYYNSSQPTYYHMTSSLDYAKDEIANQSDQMTIYDDSVIADTVVSKKYYVDENQEFDIYGGYRDCESVAITDYLIESSVEYPTSSGTVAVAHAVISDTQSQSLMTATTSMECDKLMSVATTKKAKSSLLSSLTNVASQISQPTYTSLPSSAIPSMVSYTGTTSTSNSKAFGGGGMFGSIFGKAAAAVQTATQVVNQGASMASTKVQKNFQSASAVPSSKRPSSTEELTTCTPANITVTATKYERSILAHQDSLSSPHGLRLGGDDDYDTSNIPPNEDEEFDHHLYKEEHYCANQNQPNELTHNKSLQKLLPTVPPGVGSIGKKLPTINDKSVCLVKQQPTEIYEEDRQVFQNKSQSQPYLKTFQSYDIDSEQDDYYMDTQPLAPSAEHAGANGYYEGANSGSSNYRDDYFNEDDELKYLEKEKILENKQQLNKVQTPLQNGVDDNYKEDMSHSEDSGNYIDDSSSESVNGLPAQQQVAITTVATSLFDSHIQPKLLHTTTTTTSVPSAPHQQIKKQDSIIFEEDEKGDFFEPELPDVIASPSKYLSRRSSNDIFEGEHDQIGDLQVLSTSLKSSQSRKMKLMRCETEEVVGGYMQIMKRKTEVTSKQRWHWAYNKIIMQLNVSIFILYFIL